MAQRWKAVTLVAAVCLAPALVGPSAVGAQAGPTPTNPLTTLRGLVTLCGHDDPTSRAACGSYITGFVAGSQATKHALTVRTVVAGVVAGAVAPSDLAIEASAAKADAKSSLFCIRSYWTAGQVQSLVLRYGRKHRDQFDEPAADHMLTILVDAFPCGASAQ